MLTVVTGRQSLSWSVASLAGRRGLGYISQADVLQRLADVSSQCGTEIDM